MLVRDATSSGNWRLPVALGILYVVWGSTYLAIRVMVRSVPPLLGTGARFLIAGLVLALVMNIRQRDGWDISRSQIMGAGTAGLLILVGGIGLVTVAEQNVSSSLTALVIASIPLWVVLLRLLHREVVPSSSVAAVVTGFVGLVILLQPGEGEAVAMRPLFLLIGAAILTATGAFYSKKMVMPPNAFVAASIEMLISGGVLLLGSVLTGELRDVALGDISGESWAAFVYLVTIGSLVAYSAFVWLLENARVSTVATYAYVNPVVAVILGVLILDERVAWTMGIGAVLIVLSVVLIVGSEQTERVP